MNWLRTSPIDEQVDKATSENLPAGTEDLALNLEICDQIRSKQVGPKDAAKALKRRISHKNPNVQLLALGLTDACVKNGGPHFLVEVASRDFIDNLTSILKTPTGCNIDVKNKILTLIQTWGRLFRGKQDLGYVCDVYMILQHDGYQFPPADNVGAALVETAAPPDWTDSDVCTRCRTAFTLTNRKHHCRACGATFCGQCSSKTMPLPHLGVNQDVRVCDGCWMKKKMGGRGTAVVDTDSYGGFENIASPNLPKQSTVVSSSANNTDHDDEELRKAIELSLKEAGSRPGYSAPSSTRKDDATSKGQPLQEEDDADLLAAIEASLRETNLNHSSNAKPSQSNQKQTAYEAYSFTTPEAAVDSPTGLTQVEKENVELFSSLVDKIQMTNGSVSGNRELQALYEQISKLQMKLALDIEESDKKQKNAIQFVDQIDQAVRGYDQLLQERLSATYQNRVNTNTNNYNYPQDSRYSQYTPTGPYNQSTAPFAPQAPYHYQSSSILATAPFSVSSPPIGLPGPEMTSPSIASAPPPVQSISQVAYHFNQDPFQIPAPQSFPISTPNAYTGDQIGQQGYSSIILPLQQQQSTGEPINQVPYPYNAQQSQPYVPPVTAASVNPVEEKPLIEF
ncbi:Vacuolar protein-sorting-associated protein 27 [Entomortierella beljakovae]|nr:Vacuolar protein-sorting-associated protein 27 [Entomortierella beljakovae]